MGWARTLFLGDIGNRLDIADTERDISMIRRQLRHQNSIDDSQDAAIQRLREENIQLELCLSAVVRTLQSKGILSADEVANLVAMVDDEEGASL